MQSLHMQIRTMHDRMRELDQEVARGQATTHRACACAWTDTRRSASRIPAGAVRTGEQGLRHELNSARGTCGEPDV